MDSQKLTLDISPYPRFATTCHLLHHRYIRTEELQLSNQGQLTWRKATQCPAIHSFTQINQHRAKDGISLIVTLMP